METSTKREDSTEKTFAERGFDSKFEGKVMPTLVSKYARIVELFRSHLWRTSAETKRLANFLTFTCFSDNIVAKDCGKTSWDNIVNNYLKDDQCLFVIYDYDYVKDPQARLTSKARRPRHRYVFLFWQPDKANNWEKRLYDIMHPKFRGLFGRAMIDLDLKASRRDKIKSDRVVSRLRLMA
eukprot:g1975.t1